MPRGEVGRPDKRVRKPSPGVRGAPCRPISGAEPRRSIWCAGLRPRRRGYWRRFFGENRCNRSFGWVTLFPGVAVEAREGAHLGKIGYLFCSARVNDGGPDYVGSLGYVEAAEAENVVPKQEQHKLLPFMLQAVRSIWFDTAVALLAIAGCLGGATWLGVHVAMAGNTTRKAMGKGRCGR